MRLVPLLFVALAALPAQAQTCPPAGERVPLLREVAGDDGLAVQALDAYACAYTADRLNSTADLLRVLALRDTVLARLNPRVEEWFFADEAQRYEQMEAFDQETESLALVPVTAEGMLFGLARGPLMDGVATTLAPPDLVLYLDFVDAEGETQGGEYPFFRMDARVRMVLTGERLRREFPASPFVARTQEAYAEALLTLASLHPVTMPEMDTPTWFAGVGTSEFYPWASDDDALAAFVTEAEAEGSRYHAPFSALLARPPEAASETPLDVIVLGGEWESREDASARALAHLDSGQDVAGPMLIGDTWHVVYRYFPAGDARVQAAENRAEEVGLGPRTMRYTPPAY